MIHKTYQVSMEVARRKVRKRAEFLPVGRFLMLFARFLSGLRQQLAFRQDGKAQIGVFHAEGQRAVRQ